MLFRGLEPGRFLSAGPGDAKLLCGAGKRHVETSRIVAEAICPGFLGQMIILFCPEQVGGTDHEDHCGFQPHCAVDATDSNPVTGFEKTRIGDQFLTQDGLQAIPAGLRALIRGNYDQDILRPQPRSQACSKLSAVRSTPISLKDPYWGIAQYGWKKGVILKMCRRSPTILPPPQGGGGLFDGWRWLLRLALRVATAL